MQTGYLNLAKTHECTACMACVDACPHKVLSYSADSNGYLRIVPVNAGECTHCGKCVRTCPVVNADGEKELPRRESFAAWNLDPEQRIHSASGGVFAAVAAHVLEMGGIVYGAVIKGFEVRHARIDSVSDLILLQGTKYQPSIPVESYAQVRRDLKEGYIVLFSGLSCQIAGLLKSLGKTDISNLYTIDTICGGVSTLLPMRRLENSGRYDGIVSFRDKEHGWRSKGFRYCLKMRLKDGSIEDLGSDNEVIKSFSSIILKRASCLTCKFNGIERSSDITMGDFWGDRRFVSEHAGGLSCVTATERGLELLASSNLELKKIDISEIMPCNPNLYWAKYPFLRFVPERFVALFALRHELGKVFKAVTSYDVRFPWVWRLYLRFNDKKRQKFLRKIHNH